MDSGFAAGEIKDARNGRVLLDDIDDLMHQTRHLVEGNVLASLRLTKDEAGILLREESLGDLHVQHTGRGHQDQGQDQRRELVPEHEFKAPVITAQHRLEAALAELAQAARRLLVMALQKQRAHDRRQG